MWGGDRCEQWGGICKAEVGGEEGLARKTQSRFLELSHLKTNYLFTGLPSAFRGVQMRLPLPKIKARKACLVWSSPSANHWASVSPAVVQ